MNKRSNPQKVVILHVFVGGLFGVLFLHPLTMVIYWFEFHPITSSHMGLWGFISSRMMMAFHLNMLSMTGLFALLGSIPGLGSGLYYKMILSQQKQVTQLEQELNRTLTSLVDSGEGPNVEFKSSMRWDYKQNKRNKTLEIVIIKTICGFLNSNGGSLLIGVSDTGEILGLEKDFATLKRKDADGFEQMLLGMVCDRLGGEISTLLHTLFHTIDGKEVCRVLVEPAPTPVYLRDGNSSHYYVRAGSSTRELDVPEALAHIKHRGILS